MRTTNISYLGVDPGNDKTGFAWVDANGEINRVAVLPTKDLPELLLDILKEDFEAIIIGNGTNNVNVKNLLCKFNNNIKMITIEESYSTEDARKLYWQEQPPKGWRKLVPLGLQVPPINLDGYAAAVLVQRYLTQSKKGTG